MFDANMILSEAQDLSQAAGDYDSTNVIDLGSGGDFGDGQPGVLEFWIPEAFAGAGATLTIKVCDGTTATPTDTLLITKTFALTALVASKKEPFFAIPLPAGEQGVRRYIKVVYTIATATTTAGTMTAGIRGRGV